MVSDRKTGLGAGGEEQELEELFASYVDRLNRGDELNPQKILAKHPRLGEQLLACLEDYVGADTVSIDAQLQTLGDYTLRRQIGRGGMGVVYDAWQNSLDRQVALKVLPVGVAADDRTFHRFMREAKTAARLNHENVVRVYGMGVESNTPYFAMEYVDGKTLGQLLAKWETDTDEVIDPPFGRTKEGLVDYLRIATAFADMADGLHHAHSKGVIHRDIKPSNLILDGTGRLRILDFGLARLEGQAGLTLTHDVVGTPLYMSPEQARRRKIPIDHRTDIYSLGATLYEMLTRRPPFRGKDNQETLTQIIEHDPSPLRRFDPTIPKSLETIVLKSLRKSPKERYDTAEAVAEDLRRFARGEPINAQPRPPWSGASRWVRKNGARIGVTIMTLSFIVFIVYSLLPTEGITTRQVLTMQDMELNNFWDMRPSPDGRQIAYSRMGTDGLLFVRDLESGKTTQLTTGESTFSGDDGPVWSPDAKRIAYRVQESQALEIVDVATKVSFVPSGTEGLRLTPLDWSPDGAHLLCTLIGADKTWSMVRLTLSTGDITTLVPQGWTRKSTAVFSRDGRFIAYSADENDNRDVFVIATDGSEKQRISDAPGPDRHPLWSPLGDELVYTSPDGVWAVRVKDGVPAERPRSIRSTKFGLLLVWTAQGELFYTHYEGFSKFYSLPIDAESGTALGPPRLLLDSWINTAGLGAWSPDMKTFASSEHESGGIRLYSTTDKSTRLFFIGTEWRASRLWWSNDGKRIFCEPRDDPRGNYILALEVASGTYEPLFDPMAGEKFDTSPNTQEMLFYRWNGHRFNGRRELVIAEVGQREGRVLAAEQEEELGRLSNWIRPRFSPDGRQVMFGTQVGDIWVAATDGSGKKKLATAEIFEYQGRPGKYLHSATWHPRGKFIVFDNWRDFYVVNVETGEQWKLSVDKRAIEGISVQQWSPDGKQIVFTSRTRNGPELWAVKNLLAMKVAKK